MHPPPQTAAALARWLRQVFRLQRREVLLGLADHVDEFAAVPRRAPPLTHYTRGMAQHAKVLLLPASRHGAESCFRRLLDRIRRKPSKGARPAAQALQALAALFGISEVFHEQVHLAVEAAALAFCQATNDTTQLLIQDAIDQTRQELHEGLSEGAALRDLSERIHGVFSDPARALTIAATETQRAMHQGSLLAAKASGVVSGKRWLASSDACDACLALTGKVYGLDEPFCVNPRGGPYAVCQHPPLHPRCMCSITEVLDL